MSTVPERVNKPVYVSPLDPKARFRIVRVEVRGPELAQARPCASTDELVEFVREIRPDVDLSGSAGEIDWEEGHAWEWSGI